MSNVVLKSRHSLVGRSLLPLILEAKGNDAPAELARLKKDHPLERYSQEELSTEFHKLTGETARSVLRAIGHEESVHSMRHLMHFAIVAANTHGAPKGQGLAEPVSGPSSTGSAAASSIPPSGSLVTNAVDTTSSGWEARMKTMEQSVSDLKSKNDQNIVEDALRQVRILASRPKLTQSHVLIASLESLVDAARKVSHKDTDFYSKALSACRRFDEDEDICGLCLKLLGSSEDRKISSAIAEWVKGKKHEREATEGVTSKPKSVHSQPQHFQLQAPLSPFPYPYPGFPGFAQFGYPMPGTSYYGGSNFQRQRMRRPSRGAGVAKVCFMCKQPGQFMADCTKFKKE